MSSWRICIGFDNHLRLTNERESAGIFSAKSLDAMLKGGPEGGDYDSLVLFTSFQRWKGDSFK